MAEQYTPAQKKACLKYLAEKTDSIQIRVKRGVKDEWRAAATASGKSLNRFIMDAVEHEIAQKS